MEEIINKLGKIYKFGKNNKNISQQQQKRLCFE